jgi:hypothetical protein
MSRRARVGGVAAFSIGLAPAMAQAHAFGAPYTLPVPLWLYASGCAATLILTFAFLAVFLRDSPQQTTSSPFRALRLPPLLLVQLRAGALACLLLTMTAGLAGPQDPDGNIAMQMFWILFLLGLAYLTALVGDLYAMVNPWRTAMDLLERCGVSFSVARLPYPRWLGTWPAMLLYLALVYLELFGAGAPANLGWALVAYSVLALASACLFGAEVFFGKMDVFSVYFRTIGLLAPVAYHRTTKSVWTARFRRPLVGALEATPSDAGLVVFVLFMLSSTAYDSLHDTQLWTGLFWKTALTVLSPIWGGDLGRAQTTLMGAFLAWRQAGLAVFPFLYLALYLATLGLARLLTPTAPPARQTMYIFCNSLVPIALGYNVAHYFSFFVTQIISLPALGSAPPILPMALVWHVEVAAILVGHVASVYLAHLMALQTFSDRRGVIVGQVSLLALMVAYTIFGLRILSLPAG